MITINHVTLQIHVPLIFCVQFSMMFDGMAGIL